MAYFDNPERMEEWQEELKALRAERQRRQNKGAEPAAEAEAGLEMEAGLQQGAESVHEMAQRISAPYAGRRESAHSPVHGAPDSPLREEITFEQLEADAGVRKSSSVATKSVGMQKEFVMGEMS